MEARIQLKGRNVPADLVVMTPSEAKTFTDFFPVNVNQTYIEVGFRAAGTGHILIYKDGTPFYGDTVASPATDDENHVFFFAFYKICLQCNKYNVGIYIGWSHCRYLQSSLFPRWSKATHDLWNGFKRLTTTNSY